MEKLCGHCAKYYQHYILNENEDQYKPIYAGHCVRKTLRPYIKNTSFDKPGCVEWEMRSEKNYEFGAGRERCYNVFMEPLLKRCRLCPRACGVDRTAGQKGICGAGTELKVARAALHLWEEPCISGDTGSGTVFFSHCPLHCVYCQNAEISEGQAGAKITVKRLKEIFLELQEENAANINLVTPTHYVPHIIAALRTAKEAGLNIPIVYNCGGYESVHALRLLEGYVDVWLTDFKYMDGALAKKYSSAEDYPRMAKLALREMVRQSGDAVFNEIGMMQKGVIVRHLLLPGCLEDSKMVVRYLYDTYGDQIYLSLMNQYTPMLKGRQPKELRRRVSDEEYEQLIDYAIDLGLQNGFVQEGGTAEESFVPPFDLTGVVKEQ